MLDPLLNSIHCFNNSIPCLVPHRHAGVSGVCVCACVCVCVCVCARMERRLFQNYRHACVCMQIRFLICIHAREASSMYKPRARVYANLICIHAREASCTHARHAFMQITMHVLVRRIWFRSTTCTCVLMETFERLGETVQLCNVYWPLEDFDKTDVSHHRRS